MSRFLATVVLLAAGVLAACSSSAPATQAPETTDAPSQTPVPATATVTVVAAAASCDQLITRAMDTASDACGALDRNQACYGNNLVQAEFLAGTTASFTKTGDITALVGLKKIVTAPLDEQAQQWGIAVLKVQADIPGTLPGQNVTFLLFGDSTIDNPTPDMRAVTISTGIGQLACTNAPPSALLVQSPEGRRVAMKINGADVTLASTVYITAVANQNMTLATLEGSGTVTAFGTTQTVLPGAQVHVPLGTAGGLSVVGPPSPPEPIDTTALAQLPVRVLARPVTIPPPIAATALTVQPPTATSSPLPPPTVAPTATATPCAPRANWTATYTVSSGDTLSRIAQRFGVSMSDLQTANCIQSPAEITVGQALRVPFVPPTATPSQEPATATPTGPNLRADATTLSAGQCTTIHWDADDIQAAYFEGQPTSGHNQRQVCPKATTTYTLLLVTPDGEQTPYTVTLTVAAAGAVCGNNQCEPSEDSNTCASDCAAVCGNNVCEVGENEATCASDCAES